MKHLIFQWMIGFAWGIGTAYGGINWSQAAQEHTEGQPVTVLPSAGISEEVLSSQKKEAQRVLVEAGAGEEEVQDVLLRTRHLFEAAEKLSPEDQEKMLKEWNRWLQAQEESKGHMALAEPDIDRWEILEVEQKKQLWYDSTTDTLQKAAEVISATATKERLLRFVILASQCALFGHAGLMKCFFDFTLGETGIVCSQKLAKSVTEFFGCSFTTFTWQVQTEIVKLGACLMTNYTGCTKSVLEASHTVQDLVAGRTP